MRKNIVFALMGLIVGGVASYLYCKKRFDDSCGEVAEAAKDGLDEIAEAVKEGHGMESDIKYESYTSKDVPYDLPKSRTYGKIVNMLYANSDSVEPSAITEIQFCEECEDYDKLTVLYYKDGVIMDERDELIENVDNVIGIKNLSLFGYGSSDNDVLYVRNDKLKIDYEVLKQNVEYYQSDD